MPSLKTAIAEKCKQCTYDATQPGSWRQQVEDCTVRTCPLWEVRPLTNETISVNRKKKNNEIDLNSILDSLEDDDTAEMLA